MESEATTLQTVLDRETLLLEHYHLAGGNIAEALRTLGRDGVEIGRVALSNYIRTNPRAVEIAQPFYTQEFSERLIRKLEGHTATAIEAANLAFLEDVKTLRKAIIDLAISPDAVAEETQTTANGKYTTTATRQVTNPRLTAMLESLAALDTSFIKENLPGHRFKDGLHSKAPFVAKDDSQHKTEILNVNEGRLSADDYASLRAHADRFKSLDGRTGIPTAQQGGNGTAA